MEKTTISNKESHTGSLIPDWVGVKESPTLPEGIIQYAIPSAAHEWIQYVLETAYLEGAIKAQALLIKYLKINLIPTTLGDCVNRDIIFIVRTLQDLDLEKM